MKTLKEVSDFPANSLEKFNATAGCVKERTIEERMYIVNIEAPAFGPIIIIKKNIK